MLTRRSRKDGGATSPDIPKTVVKKSTTPQRRSKSKSVERKTRARSKSVNKMVAKVILKHVEVPAKKKKELKKKSIEPVDSKFRKSPTPVNEFVNSISSTFEDKMNNDKISPANSSRLDYSDESDNEPILVNHTKTNLSVVDFGGPFFNIIFALLLPILVIVAKIAIKAKGNLIPFPRGYLRYANYYDQDVFLWTAAIVIIQLFISLVPLAKKSKGLRNDDSYQSYRFSGFMNLFVGVLIVAMMHYYKLPINFIQDMVTKKSVPHIVASVLCAFIISIVLYIKSKYSKQIIKFDSLNIIQKLFVGTSSNPTLGPINVKLVFYRYSLLLTILFNYVIVVDSLKNPINIHLYVVAGFQIIYALDKLIFEFNLLPSFYLQKEKDGYWTLIQLFIQPAINVLPIQILLANNVPVNYIILSISSIFFLLGYICQRYSEFTRYQYEINSKYPGVKRIAHGIWSFVRYPNYLGAIIVHLAVILPVFEPSISSLQTYWPIFLCPLYYIVTLSHRCARVTTTYRLQYGYTWDYPNTVKWNLIPKIF